MSVASSHNTTPHRTSADTDSAAVSQPAAGNVDSTGRSIKTTTVCLVLLTFLAVTQALYVATSVMLPVAAALVAALACRPMVRGLAKFHLPPSIAAAIVLAALMGGFAVLADQLITPAAEWAERAPIRFHLLRLQRKLQPVQQPLTELSEASDELSRVTSAAVTTADASAVQEVVVRPPSLVNEVLSSTSQVAAGALLFLVLTYFFLAKGDVLVGRVASLFGSPDRKQSHDNAAVAVERTVSTYLMTVSAINAGLGVAVGIACWAVGVPNPMLWGAMATMLNFLPYIGGLVGAVIVLGVSLLSFDSTAYAFVAPAVYLTLTAIEGNFITPTMLGRSMSLNPLIVILSLTYWTWLWGLGGAILAVPLLAILTSLCRQFQSTRSIALVLSD